MPRRCSVLILYAWVSCEAFVKYFLHILLSITPTYPYSRIPSYLLQKCSNFVLQAVIAPPRFFTPWQMLLGSSHAGNHITRRRLHPPYLAGGTPAVIVGSGEPARHYHPALYHPPSMAARHALHHRGDNRYHPPPRKPPPVIIFPGATIITRGVLTLCRSQLNTLSDTCVILFSLGRLFLRDSSRKRKTSRLGCDK